MASARPKILLTRKLPAVVENRLRSTYDARLNTADQVMSKAELSAAMSNFDAFFSNKALPNKVA